MRLHLEQRVALVALALGAAVVLGAEWARGGASSGASPGWLTVEMTAISAALGVAWRKQEQLRLAPLLATTGLYGLGVVLVHAAVDIPGDTDSAVYASQGNRLLDGDYPRSEYPVGAVLVFGLDALIGGATILTTHALLMVPFQLVAVAGLWMLRTPWSAWSAALYALCPANLYFVHLRFDAVVVALLVLGLLFAHREQWVTAGALLGVGTAVKWSPVLTCFVVVVWLLSSRRRRDAVRHAGACAIAFLALTGPFVAWEARDALAAYTKQATRGITAESLPYLPLRLVGLAEPPSSGAIWDPAAVPRWADAAAVVVQGLLMLVVALVTRRVVRRDSAITIAALMPAIFLLTNRVFSPQFALVAFAAWTIAIGLLARSRHEQLLLGAAAMSAAYANAIVVPGFIDSWVLWSALFFTLSMGLTCWLLHAATTASPRPASSENRGRTLIAAGR